MSDAHLSQLTFESLNIAESLKRGVAELGYTRCTPIQAQTLPVALAGRDVVVKTPGVRRRRPEVAAGVRYTGQLTSARSSTD